MFYLRLLKRRCRIIGCLIVGLGCAVFSVAQAQWNNPYYEGLAHNIYFSAFMSQPKTLDPARSYNADEILFSAQVYEPPLQYHYLKRPYELVPLTAMALPLVHYYDQQGRELAIKNGQNTERIAWTAYDIKIKPNIYFQPHPAFVRDAEGRLRYARLSAIDAATFHSLQDFPMMATRELTAFDYVYGIKRLADPTVASPIYGLMSRYLIGFDDFRQKLNQRYTKLKQANVQSPFINLTDIPLSCCQVIDRYHYQIKIKGFYPQFIYWLSMPFFAPMPWEAVLFYTQPSMIAHNMTLDEYPVGTGPYMVVKNNPNSEIVLVKNPNFRGEFYPTTGSSDDEARGYLQFAGKTIPFIDKFVFSLEKESIPRWEKFLQGYYDRAAVSPEGFDQAIQFSNVGKPELTSTMKDKKIYLNTTVGLSDFYLGFNMLDPVVGGYSSAQCKLRQAISIVMDYEEFIAIFLNGRGLVAQGPIPPGIFGYRAGLSGMNPYISDWVHERIQRKSLAKARELLAEAGYPNGIDPKTQKPLVLNYDVASSGGPDEFAMFSWMRKQFAKLGIALNVRATLPNRFQDKVRSGNVQIYSFGWNADYPDPENFLFLFYGPNGTVKYQGENTSNYANSKVDQLFLEIAKLPNGAERQQKINEIMAILQQESPWVWGYYPIDFVLSHAWLAPIKASAVANNVLKYYHLDPKQRQEQVAQWNKPILWPVFLVIIFIILLFLPLMVSYYKRLHRPNIKRYSNRSTQI